MILLLVFIQMRTENPIKEHNKLTENETTIYVVYQHNIAHQQDGATPL